MARPRKPTAAKHYNLDKQLVDAVREVLGLAPLYRIEKTHGGYDPYYDESVGTGCSKVGGRQGLDTETLLKRG